MHANTHLSGWTHTCAKRIMPKSFELAYSKHAQRSSGKNVFCVLVFLGETTCA